MRPPASNLAKDEHTPMRRTFLWAWHGSCSVSPMSICRALHQRWRLILGKSVGVTPPSSTCVLGALPCLVNFFRRLCMQARFMAVSKWRAGFSLRLILCGIILATMCILAISLSSAAEHGATPEYLASFVLPITKAGDPQVERGRYLVTLGGCHDCHTPKGPDGRPRLDRLMSGHPEGEPAAAPTPGLVSISLTATSFSGPWGTSFARNLTPDKHRPWQMDRSAFHQDAAHRDSGQRRAAASFDAMGVVPPAG